MTDARFEQLVNLYLDKEISPKELLHLKLAISKDEPRLAQFHQACRMHEAERRALAAFVESQQTSLEESASKLAIEPPALEDSESAGRKGRIFKFRLFEAAGAAAVFAFVFTVAASWFEDRRESAAQMVPEDVDLSQHDLGGIQPFRSAGGERFFVIGAQPEGQTTRSTVTLIRLTRDASGAPFFSAIPAPQRMAGTDLSQIAYFVEQVVDERWVRAERFLSIRQRETLMQVAGDFAAVSLLEREQNAPEKPVILPEETNQAEPADASFSTDFRAMQTGYPVR